MNAQQVAKVFGFEKEYKDAVKEIDSNHVCDQGCGEGWCSNREDSHQYKLIQLMKTIREDGKL